MATEADLTDLLAESGEKNSTKKPSKRPFCERCKRPKKVCLCEALPESPVEISSTVYILQHPDEQHRLLTTVPILSACLPTHKCIVYRDKRYSQEKYPELHELLKNPQTLVLYPDPNGMRPKKVCLCEALPESPVEISSTVYILQHPDEQHRLLTTVPILSACLPTHKCIVYRDKRYSQEKYPELHELLKNPQTLVLYPDPNARDLREVIQEGTPGLKYNLVVPDGTWRQARAIYKQNNILQRARKVQLNENRKSHYVIRTQPTKNSLSTLEAIAVSLSIMEGREEIAELLVKPLQLLCRIQIAYGAVPHSSKEEKREQQKLEEKKQSAINKKSNETDEDEPQIAKRSKLDNT